MNTLEIVYMWGFADGFELSFTRQQNGKWTASVPPDLSDGQYAVEIHGLIENGYVCIWTGILYMNKGKHCLRLNDSKYYLRLKPQAMFIFKDRFQNRIRPRLLIKKLRYISNRYHMRFRRCYKL